MTAMARSNNGVLVEERIGLMDAIIRESVKSTEKLINLKRRLMLNNATRDSELDQLRNGKHKSK